MKIAQRFLLVLMAAGLLTGCMRYDVTLNNGMRYTNVSKPSFNEKTGEYTITTAGGNKTIVRKSRVSVIEPHKKSKVKGASDGSDFFLQ